MRALVAFVRSDSSGFEVGVATGVDFVHYGKCGDWRLLNSKPVVSWENDVCVLLKVVYNSLETPCLVVKVLATRQHKLFKPAVGAGLAVMGGLISRNMPMGERWVNAGYQYLVRFGARGVTKLLALSQRDNCNLRMEP